MTVSTTTGAVARPLQPPEPRLEPRPVANAPSDLDEDIGPVSELVDATVTAISTTLKKGGTVSLVGFGTFSITKRAARSGRNPRTGDTIKIKSAKVPKFKPGKALKDAVN